MPRISDRSYGVIGAIGVPIGIAGIAAGVWTGIYAVQEANTILNIVYGQAIIFGLAALAVIGFLVKECLATERSLLESEAKRIQAEAKAGSLQAQHSAALEQLAELNRRFCIVAMPFEEVSKAILALEASAAAFRDYTPGAKVIQIRERKRDDLNKCFNDVLLAICNAAANVLPIKKGKPFAATSPTCSANIKTIKMHGDDAIYEVVKRSSHSHHKRYDDDRMLRRPVMKNMLYHEMIRSEDAVIVADIDEYLGRIESSAALQEMFDEPKAASVQYYKSCLVAPIFSPRQFSHTGEPLPLNLVGIMCVDSLLSDFFDSEYDKTIITLLCNQAQSCLRVYVEALTARNLI